ncbi:CBS domain-containing protein [Actinoplanes sp. GCM10030250]|uniref:CBS domain-containing protein n=1 Tax=Actinoplanes sp. GCM10030250 TaxID=3273376 RepID=UPI0036189C4A
MKTWHVSDVMTTDVVAVGPDTPYRDLVDLLTGNRISAVPVIDAFRRVIGVVSESDVLAKIGYAGSARARWFQSHRRAQQRKAEGRTAGELMTAPAVAALTNTTVAAAARRMDEEGVKWLPVEDDLGRLAGIVTRGDLLKEHLRSDADIRADVQAAVDEVLLAENVAAMQVEVARGTVTLTGRVERWSTAVLAARRASLAPGVVRVTERITYVYDDREAVESVPAFFVA